MESLQARFYIIDCHDSANAESRNDKNKMLCLHYYGLPRKAKAFLAMTKNNRLAMTKRVSQEALQ